MSILPIPPAHTATDPIASPADLRQRWRALVGASTSDEHLLRFAFVGVDRRLITVLSEVPIHGIRPATLVDDLMVSLAVLVAGIGEGSSVAFLLTRPGTGGVSRADRAWVDALVAGAAEHGVPIEPVFQARGGDVVPVLPGSAAA
ncbi:hypothetical protein [Mycolicibacterium sediminis]|uniref:Uncharacterized protein n=1 Tax=Mycolicibacterium sediminis TaxID=1286180 RepID=A0A7I7QTN6_9MYCO|nr:hypothetical protein [Mycolicibacterium sediminis]BBY29779.1 hypothetical protein MSEDJ_38750 [Mycolicibacterium sediminis]